MHRLTTGQTRARNWRAHCQLVANVAAWKFTAHQSMTAIWLEMTTGAAQSF